MAEDEDAWKKLPTEQKVQHKSWKARAEGYKECVKNFRTWDEGSPEFNKYLGLVKKFVTDPNELVRIQGLEAVLPFVENANVAKKTCGEVVSGIILKCLNTKPRLKEAAIDVCLMYIEIDKNELTQEELIKGFSNKQPKVATACLEAVTRAFSLFGSKVMQAKPLLKEIPKLADHRDKNVREAVKALAVEIYRWVGPAIRTPLQNINAVMFKELEEEWTKVDASGKPTQTRFMRSQQDLREKMEAKAVAAAGGGKEGGESGEAVEEQAEVDPYDLLDPVEILSKLPKNFYEQIEAKKWQERKEMLEACQKLCESPKIEPGDFGDLVRALKKVIAKDSNVMLVTIAAKCVAGLAKGIRKKFHPYSSVVCDAIFEKFKEKKPYVIAALQDAIDSVYLSTSIQALNESISECLDNKNPSIREQTALFVSRALAKTKASALSKATIKPLVQALLKNIDHSAATVRDATYQALGMLLKLVGEKVMLPFIADLDNLKMEKIKEYAGKAEIKGKAGGAKQVKAVAPPPEQPAKAASKPKVIKGGAKGKAEKGGAKKTKASKAPESAQGDSKPQEPMLNDLAVEEQINEFLSEEVLKQIGGANWKERLEGLQSLSQKMKLTEVKSIPCQAIIKTIGSGKPGWKDNNFNCLNEKFAIIKNLAENALFSKTSGELCLSALIDKIGDVKSGKASKEAITAIAEATSFPWVSDSLMEISMSHKNPKIQAESLSWLSEAIKEFGMAGVNVKLVIAKIKIGFAATNPGIRTAAFAVMSTMTLYIGPKIRMFFENEKPALLQQIDSEIEKCKGESPPAPTRGGKSSSSNTGESDDEEEESTTIKVEDLVPRVNIADSITDGLITKLSDKNWKMRKEALEEVTRILNEAKFVEPTIGELATALKMRLSDSNKILVATTLTIITQLSIALGPHCPKHAKIFAPGLVGVLADVKPNVRQTGLNAMNEWLSRTNLSLWFEDEIISTALSVPKHTYLRIELLNWLAEKLVATPKLTSSAKEGMEACVKHLYSCCEDRAGDVRAKAQAALPGFIYHLGIDKMTRMCGKLNPTSTNVITALLDKSKELVPARKTAAVKRAKAAPRVEVDIDVPDEPKEAVSKTSTALKQKESTTSTKSASKSKRPTSKKAQEEPEAGPALIKIPNGKEQRIKDEQKLKTLKWIFDTPREELTSQLKSQLTPCVSSTLATEMFHSDFQHHIKALSILTQAMTEQWDETVGTLDQLLRWITLRFYEKNTTVHMKCLEYLKTLFDKLEQTDFRLTDSEAGSFIPHLITKIGEPKENIRKDVHTIMQRTTRVYPAGKVFGFLMHGLGTKNSRQKTECLDELGLLITSYGIEVCQPTPPKALREVATHIGDRDNSVRSAALNVLVAAYNSCGDMVYKYVGKLNEKDMSMLEERIKRSGKFTNEPPAMAVPVKSDTKMQKPSSKPIQVNTKPKISTSDLHSSASLESEVDENQYRLPELLDTECADLLNEPDFEVPQRFAGRASGLQKKATSASVDATLNAVIASLASSDMDVSLKAAHQLDELLNHKDKHDLLKPKIDQIVTTSCIQIRLATNRYLSRINPNNLEMEGEGDADHILPKVMSLYKSLFAINYLIFNSEHLAVLASQDALQDFTHAIVVFLLDKRVNDLPEGQRIIAMLNVLVGRMVENSNPTNFRCALIHIVHTTMESSGDNVRELICKCVWKAFRNLQNYLSPPDGSILPPLQPSLVLEEIHKFYTAYPPKSLAHGEIDRMASRTIRSVIITLCQDLGLGILDAAKGIENIESSEVMAVIKKQLKASNPASAIDAYSAKAVSSKSSDKKENMGIMNGDLSPGRQLSLIVKKVGNREQTKQGMQELYDFKLKYPDYDIESGFTNMTPLFLNYIKRSLANIEQDRAKGVTDASNILKSTNKNLKAKDYFERIKMLRAKCGLPIDHLPQNDSESRVLSANSNTLNQGSGGVETEKQLHAPLIKTVDSGTSHEMPERMAVSEQASQRPSTASNVEELKRRLEKIKRERKRN